MAVEFIKVTPGKTRKVRIVSGTRFAGRHLNENKEIEVPESEAYLLVHSGKAEFVTETEKAEKGK